MKKKMRVMIIIIFLVIFSAAVYLYREYNRKPPDIITMRPQYTVEATLLINDFINKDSLANKKYLGKLVEVVGFVKQVDSSRQQNSTNEMPINYILVMGDSASLSSVRCNLKNNVIAEPLKHLNKTVKIKGICTGYIPDDMGLGSDIILENAILSNDKNQ